VAGRQPQTPPAGSWAGGHHHLLPRCRGASTPASARSLSAPPVPTLPMSLFPVTARPLAPTSPLLRSHSTGSWWTLVEWVRSGSGSTSSSPRRSLRRLMLRRAGSRSLGIASAFPHAPHPTPRRPHWQACPRRLGGAVLQLLQQGSHRGEVPQPYSLLQLPSVGAL
jgi:hypothetical protein